MLNENRFLGTFPGHNTQTNTEFSSKHKLHLFDPPV
jgi:hypothetical protein